MSRDRLLIKQIVELRRQRPFARVLVIEHNYDDVPGTIEALRALNLPAGDGDTNPLLVLPAKVYTQRRRRVGPVDVVFVHNQHNIARADDSPGYLTALNHLRAQHGGCEVRVIQPSPLLGVTDARASEWPCGTPYAMSGRPMRLFVPSPRGEPCGFLNPHGSWFCQNCGMFRGLKYEKVK
jgi:hypothetical protein